MSSVHREKVRIAIIDDDQDILELLNAYLLDQGFLISTFLCPISFIQRFRPGDYDLILSDVMMPGKSGIEIIEEVKVQAPNLPIILLTAHAAVEEAVLALRKGAYDFMQKPFLLDRLHNTINRALDNYFLLLENDNLKVQVKSRQFSGIMGRSKAMGEIGALIDRIGPTSANVLITGESGTGKEVVARSIHARSANPQGPFIAINCAAIPEALLESELFGHVKGAFTGASTNRPGLFQEAKNGSLFLDEIGDMPVSLQSKLLRVLQERKIRPIGANSYHKIEVRIIAATHQDLQKAVQEGKFREDLYYRLTVIPIHVPPLRSRPEDIPGLAQFF